MSSINYDLRKIKAFVFDVDGVLSPSSIPMDDRGLPIRFFNVKDRYALRHALRRGFIVAIISGAKTESIRLFFDELGVKELFLNSSDKEKDYVVLKEKMHLEDAEILYSGDDIPDLKIMERVGLPIAPADASHEIISIAKYVSLKNGGDGVARDVIEQVMRAQDKWL